MKNKLKKTLVGLLGTVALMVPLVTSLTQKVEAAEKPTVSEYFGISQDAIVNELKAHENDNYYLTTPYDGLYTDPNPARYLRPNGDTGGNPAGMNCTGFVAYVIQKAGGDLSKIANNTTRFGSYANAFAWRDVLSANAYTLTYDNASEMLADGKLEKGDIIYMDPDTSYTGYDSHIGFFWGDSPSDNKFWHSYDNSAGNQISALMEKSPTQKYYVFKDKPFTQNVQIKKVDRETGLAVPGTTFRVEFSGEDAPATQEVTTGADGTYTINDVPRGTSVTATEISVPSPYVLGSVVGESDVVTGMVGLEDLVLTQKNTVAKGQITIEKSGVESNKTAWNSNYTLQGNVFEIRKDTATGAVVETVTTNADGHAETSKTLPLGTYVVTEKTASNGFANTFKPVTVKIEYADQTTSVVIKGSEGTNQEVVGTTELTKQDAETGAETQGKATFDGATYGLFHKDGTPVKWSENFKPVATKGTPLTGDEVKFEVSNKEQTVGVGHLALGDYYWQELVAPEGYQIDNTKREFSITYKDQDTKVIDTTSTSQENVIKFNLDGFKYLQSKGGEVASGYNGIDFTLTPVAPTKGEVQTSTTKTDANGYDGYWNFSNIPYGDYTMSEVKAPEGYKTIKDLHIKSSFNSEKREYTFTITEEGQKEALKTLTVPEATINEGSNVISLSKLFLTNKVVEMPTIRTKATVNGEKTFTPSSETPMQDVATITGAQKGTEYTNKIKLWRIVNKDYDNAQVAWEGEHDFESKGDSEEDVIKQIIDTSKDDNTVSYVFTEELFLKDGPKVAEHNDLTNTDQTITPVIPELPTIQTLFVTKDGSKTFDPTKDQDLDDQVEATVPKEDVGKTFYYVTQFHKVDSSGTSSVVVGEDSSEHTAKEMSYTFTATYSYKANTLKDGEKLVATHIAYKDKEHKEEYAKHFDLTNEKQTLTAKTPDTPITPKTPGGSSRSIPQTSGSLGGNMMWVVLVLVLASVGGILLYRNKKNSVKE